MWVVCGCVSEDVSNADLPGVYCMFVGLLLVSVVCPQFFELAFPWEGLLACKH